MLELMISNSTSLIGWECLASTKDLGSNPVYANCVLFKSCIIFNDNMLDHDEW